MSLRHLAFDAIDHMALQALIQNGTAESQVIEYKREPCGGSDADRKEFLADVSSLANTMGGDLLIGVVAEHGIPVAFAPLQDPVEPEQLRIEGMVRDGIQPRIHGVQVKSIALPGGGAVLLVRVPRSYNSPHRVDFKGQNRFWARTSAGKYEPSVDELRALFVRAPALAEKLRDLRCDRVVKIAAGVGPVSLEVPFCLVLHVVPLSAFDLASPMGVSVAQLNGNPGLLPPLGRTSPTSFAINFDGFLACSRADITGPQVSYTQLFHSGVIEGAACLEVGLPARVEYLAQYIISGTYRYACCLSALGVAPPFGVIVSLLGTTDKSLQTGNNGMWADPAVPIHRDQMHFREVILDTIPASEGEAKEALGRILSQLFNAAGAVYPA